MALSSWPEKFQKKDSEPKGKIVTVEIDSYVQIQTLKATGFGEDGDRELIWIPHSQSPQTENAKVGEYFQTIDIPEWLAEEKGLLEC